MGCARTDKVKLWKQSVRDERDAAEAERQRLSQRTAWKALAAANGGQVPPGHYTSPGGNHTVVTVGPNGQLTKTSYPGLHHGESVLGELVLPVPIPRGYRDEDQWFQSLVFTPGWMSVGTFCRSDGVWAIAVQTRPMAPMPCNQRSGNQPYWDVAPTDGSYNPARRAWVSTGEGFTEVAPGGLKKVEWHMPAEYMLGLVKTGFWPVDNVNPGLAARDASTASFSDGVPTPEQTASIPVNSTVDNTNFGIQNPSLYEAFFPDNTMPGDIQEALYQEEPLYQGAMQDFGLPTFENPEANQGLFTQDPSPLGLSMAEDSQAPSLPSAPGIPMPNFDDGRGLFNDSFVPGPGHA